MDIGLFRRNLQVYILEKRKTLRRNVPINLYEF